ncbi:MHO_1580 family protein [Candidatus Mycoplasma pogonae]
MQINHYYAPQVVVAQNEFATNQVKIIKQALAVTTNTNFANEFDYGFENHIFEIKRYLKTNLFAFKMQNNVNGNIAIAKYVQLNNKDTFFVAFEEKQKQQDLASILPPQQVNDLTFDKLKTVAFVINHRHDNYEKLYLLNQIKLESKNLYKDYQVDQHGINFKTLKLHRTEITKQQDQIQKQETIIYNNIVLLPQKFIQGEHNVIVYKVAVFNDDNENIERDLNIVANSISNLPLKTKANLDLEFKKLDSPERYGNFDIIGNIEIVSHTYYDFITKQTVKGMGPNSRQGYIIPFDFKGILNHGVNLNLNYDFKDINLFFQQEFDYEFFSLNNTGKMKLKILKKISDFQPDETLYFKNNQLSYIANEFHDFLTLKNLAYKKDEEFFE